jgi:TatD DNase family protein
MSTNIGIIDTHAHLYAHELADDISNVLERASDEGVQHIIMPNIDITSIDGMNDLAKKFMICHPAIGLHPCYVKEDYMKQLERINSELVTNKYIAVGEVGIDLYWDKSTIDIQKYVFSYQIELSRQYKLPLLIHSREAQSITIEMIRASQDGSLTGIFHCFSGTLDEARAAIDTGFYLGIGGVVTYKNSDLASVLKNIPINHVVIETDSPYLPPTPHRGKVNEPSYLKFILAKLAEIYNMSIEEVATQTTINAKKIFTIPTKTS